MSSRATSTTLGFPASVFGDAPVRLPVLFASADAVALATPPPAAGVSEKSLTPDSLDLAFCSAAHAQFKAGKAEFLALPFRPPFSVAWPIEQGIAAIALLVGYGAARSQWRNAFGSEQLVFTYHFLAADAIATDVPDAFECALPVAFHQREQRALVSRTTGKKSRTEFRRTARAGRWSWWEAKTRYPRFHQIRLHAAESGLRIVGETIYCDGGAIALEDLLWKGRLNKGQARPLHDGICLRLASVDCSGAGGALGAENLCIEAAEPAKWGVLRERLARATSPRS